MFTITTPAMLFPAISLLLLAYTNRFLVVAQLIRTLYDQMSKSKERSMKDQILHLRSRIRLIRWMQIAGVVSFITCTLSMGAILVDYQVLGKILLGISLTLLLISLCISLLEIYISGTALNMQLNQLEEF